MNRISATFINHQDPDVGSSSPMICSRYAPKSSIICSEDTWRLVVHFGLPRDRFFPTDKYPNGIKLPSGHQVLFVPTPYCHFRGAVMLYDPETRVLFSGDLFGGLTELGAAWGHVLERVLETARMFLGTAADRRISDAVELSDTVTIEAGKVSFGGLGRWSVERALDVLTRGELPETANPIKLEAIVGAESLQLPTPTVTLEESDSHIAGLSVAG